MGKACFKERKSRNYKKSMILKPEWKMKIGRPRRRWMDGVEKDPSNLAIVNWRARAQESDGWRKFL
jgi:hypothetical protein